MEWVLGDGEEEEDADTVLKDGRRSFVNRNVFGPRPKVIYFSDVR